MSAVRDRPLSELIRRWQTPFERDAVDLASLTYDPAINLLTLVLVRRSDDRELKIAFGGTLHFRVMDEIGWAGELEPGELGRLYEEPITMGRPLSTLIMSAGALRFSAWPEILFHSAGAEDWIYVIWTGWDCVEVVASGPPDLALS